MPSRSEPLADLIRYSAWASKKLLDFVVGMRDEELAAAVPNSHGGIASTFHHIYFGDCVWSARLEQRTVPKIDWSGAGPGLRQLGGLWWPLLDRLASSVEALNPDTQLSFRWYTGEELSMEVHKLVHHVVNHGTYHRGQIAAMLRQGGRVPPSTDFIFYELRQ